MYISSSNPLLFSKRINEILSYTHSAICIKHSKNTSADTIRINEIRRSASNSRDLQPSGTTAAIIQATMKYQLHIKFWRISQVHTTTPNLPTRPRTDQRMQAPESHQPQPALNVIQPGGRGGSPFFLRPSLTSRYIHCMVAPERTAFEFFRDSSSFARASFLRFSQPGSAVCPEQPNFDQIEIK